MEQVQVVSLKLMVSKEKNKVVFAEAGKDFVDVLISFLTLPLGTIARLVAKESDMQSVEVGSLSTLYGSVTNLDKDCLSADTCKEMMLQPRNPMEDCCRSLKLNIDDTEPTQYYVCDNLKECRHEISVMCSTFKNKKCSCGALLEKPISPQSSDVLGGFVKNNSSFMITDDLNVVPNSLDTMFSMLKKLGIEDMPSVEQMVVNVTKNQVLDLLKCSLLSKTVLTDVFLGKKLPLEKYELTSLSRNDFATVDSAQISVKVMYKKSDGKIVCAQGKEDFANFLLSFLTFPLGGVARLLDGCSSMGSVDRLYKSIIDLNEDYFKTKEVMDKVVDLGLAPQFKLRNQILPISESKAQSYFCYTNSYKSRRKIIHLTDFFLTPDYEDYSDCMLETCNTLDMVDPISENGSAKGFVKGPTMYMATDDLAVTQMSSISIMSLISRMNISLSDMEEKVVSIGIKEVTSVQNSYEIGLSILKASLTSTSALTNGLRHLIGKVKVEEDLLTKVKEEK
ncbi:hypothetical protein RIF29_30396 [Crotalaria pallida]|uniref:DUF674 family protein n=1 Tax=Crotalaria pallida TaxID=3830 RepID=A0AAN9I180_CROPI